MSEAPIIVTCSTYGKLCLHIMAMSVNKYAPDTELEIVYNEGSRNFGEAFNHAVDYIKRCHPDYKRIIIANDDVVLRPDTVPMMIEDADYLDSIGEPWGHIAARFDRGAGTLQNLTRNPFEAEQMILQERWIAPVFSMVHVDRWVDFPPINWGSDVIQCHDMTEAGYKIFVSRAYVHHVGGITCGERAMADREASQLWCLQNRPALAKFI